MSSTSHILGRVVFLLLALTLLSTAGAELALTQSALTGSTPVIVNQAGGKSIHGTISQCTPELLFVMPTINRLSKSPPATQPIQVPWKDIRTVSDGLTPRIALEIWMAQGREKLCPTCHGEKTIWCPVCKGTRHDPAFATTCPTCHGELLVACKTTGEVKGQVACPNSCLKLAVGSWSKHADGLMWRTWHFGNLTQQFSAHHLGDVMITDHKNVPPVADAGRCPVCGGATTVDDSICFGTGLVPCPTCLARAAAPPCPNHCEDGRVVCPTCGGTGLAQ